MYEIEQHLRKLEQMKLVYEALEEISVWGSIAGQNVEILRKDPESDKGRLALRQ